jgi:O-antigen/teichoic acid export membrane protein
MNKLTQLIVKGIRHFHNDSLYRNSIYLMASTLVMAFFGFFFWIINARIYTTVQVGYATAIFSAITLIANFSFLGLNTGLIKYLPNSTIKNEKINTSFLVTLIVTLFIGTIYFFLIPFITPKLKFVGETPLTALMFIFIPIVIVLNGLSDSVLIAYRETKYILIKNIISSVIKVGSPFLLLIYGTYGIIASISLGPLIALLISIYILYKKFAYRINLHINKSAVSKMYKFSAGNYAASLIGVIPPNIMPILVASVIGPKQAAYYFMDFMIINVIIVIQSSLSQSLLAEGSHDEKNLRTSLLKAIKLNFAILIPAIALILLFGKYVLLAFGKNYSDEGIILLNLLALSLVFTSINGILSAVLNIKGKVKLVLRMSIIGSAVLLTTNFLLIHLGLTGIGIAWIISEVLISALYMYTVYKIYEKK